jgi:20S proteasome alpha/beta subunit
MFYCTIIAMKCTGKILLTESSTFTRKYLVCNNICDKIVKISVDSYMWS